MKKTLSVLAAAITAASLLFSGGTAKAASQDIDWPKGDITLIVGYSAGGSTDLGCRAVAAGLSKELGVNVVVENITGSGNWVAWNQLLHNTVPDGYTMCNFGMGAALGHYRLGNPTEETLDDFILLGNQAYDCNAIIVHEDEDRFTDLDSFIAYAKENELMTTTTSSEITSTSVTVLKWLQEMGCKITSVPVDGTADDIMMFESRTTDFRLADIGDASREENVRLLVQFGAERSDFFPDVPTAIELGYDLEIFSIRGYCYPKGVDQAIVDKMAAALEKVINDPATIEQMLSYGVETRYMNPEEYYDAIVDTLNVRLDIWGIEH